jgi:hypothetical protein
MELFWNGEAVVKIMLKYKIIAIAISDLSLIN